MVDPITLLIACAFAAVFAFATGLDIGLKIGRALEKRVSMAPLSGQGKPIS